MSTSPTPPPAAAASPVDQGAIEHVLGLARTGALPSAARAELLAALHVTSAPKPSASSSSRLVEVGAYLGAALVFAAALTFTFLSYEDLGRSGTALVLLGLSVILGLIPLLTRSALRAEVGRGHEDADPGVVVRLGQVAALAATITLGLAVGFLSGFEDTAALAAGGLVTSLTALGAHRLLRGAEAGAQLVSFLAGGVALMSLAAEAFDGGSFPGAPLILLALIWLALLRLGVLHLRELAVLLAGLAALLGAQITRFNDTDDPTLSFTLLALLALVSFAAYARLQLGPALGIAVAATTLVIPQAVSEFTDGALGAAGGLLVGGITLLGASFLGLRLRERAGGEGSTPEGTFSGEPLRG